MKKDLREIETAGMILLAIGVVLALISGNNVGAWPCGFGLVLLLLSYIYKAFHWKKYERENKRNILILLFCILILFLQMLRLK